MFCKHCGREVDEGGAFCGHCGAPLRAIPPPGPASPTSTVRTSSGVPHYEPLQSEASQPPKKRSPLPWILGGLGLLVVAAAVLIMVFVVFAGDKAGDTGPEEAVRTFFRSLEREDADMLLGVMEPSFREELEDILGDTRDRFFELFFMNVPDDLKVDIRKTAVDIQGDEATVTVIEGTMSYTDENGEKVREEASAGDDNSFELAKVGGKWYLGSETLVELGFDLEELKDLELGELGDEDMPDDNADPSQQEMAELERAMLGYVYENAEAGLEFAVTGLLINDDEAVGIAVCLNQELENIPVVMVKDSSGWHGVDMGSGIELPTWFLAEMADVEEVMLDHAYRNSVGEMELEILNLAVRGNQAVAMVTTSDREVETAAITAEKGPGGWYVADFGTGIELPKWYWPQAYW